MFLRLKDFSEYMEKYDCFWGMGEGGDLFLKEQQLMERDALYTHREKEKIRERRNREVRKGLHLRIDSLREDVERFGVWDGLAEDEPVCPAGGSLCQNSELQKPTLIGEPVCPAGGSLCQNSEWQKPTLIGEKIEFRYRYPDKKKGDINHHLAGMLYEPEELGDGLFRVVISGKHSHLIELLAFPGRPLFMDDSLLADNSLFPDKALVEGDPSFLDKPLAADNSLVSNSISLTNAGSFSNAGSFPGKAFSPDNERDAPLAPLAFLLKYHRIAKIEHLMYQVNCFKTEYRSLRSIPDIPLRKLLQEYHRKIAAERDGIYETLIGKGMTNPKWVSEQKAYSIVKSYFPDAKFQYQAEFLFGQRLDIFIPSENVAIEYQGRQHYESVEFFGGVDGFKDNQRRDARKLGRCRANGVRVIYWDYDRPLTKEYFKEEILPMIGQGSSGSP